MTDRERDQSVERWLRQTPAAGARSESACLDAETLAAWTEGLLKGPERASAETHASGCARCQAMLAVMVRTMPGPPPRSASPLRKWLMMLSPALAAGAAVALWFAVDQRPLQSPPASMDRDERVAGQPSERASSAAASPPAVLEKDVERRALDSSLDREASKGGRENEQRFGADKATTDALAKAKPVNERKDEAAANLPPPPAAARTRAAAPPAAAPEGVQAAAGDRSAQARLAQPAAPAQQAGQNQNQSPNQNQSQNQNQSPNQNQVTPRRQAAEPVAERVVVAERPVDVGATSAVVGREAAKKPGVVAGYARGGLGFRTSPGNFDVVPPDASARWRVVEGRAVQRSFDAGATWANQYTAEDGVVLTAGAAPTSTVCWLVGRGGAIVLTTDGRDWRRVKFPEPVDLTAVTSTDARTATVTTGNGRRFLTTDGGRNWTPR